MIDRHSKLPIGTHLVEFEKFNGTHSVRYNVAGEKSRMNLNLNSTSTPYGGTKAKTPSIHINYF